MKKKITATQRPLSFLTEEERVQDDLEFSLLDPFHIPQEKKPMRKALRLLFLLASLSFLSYSLSGCNLNDDELSALHNALSPGSHQPIPGEFEPGETTCHVDHYQQPPADINRKIDILFIADTSGSLDEERDGIAQGIDAFVAALPPEAEYQIGVMLAHGSTSSHAGKLYKKGTEPHVLSSDSLSLAEIRTHLSTKLTQTVADNASDGGEEGLYALNRILEADRLSLAQSQGFFRSDAALAVVFISDENDICAQYPDGVTPVVDTNGIEPVAFNRDCANITPESTLAKVRDYMGERPLLISGIIYSNRNSYPKVNENEYGYGYAEIIQLANGVAVDLNNPHYHEGLSEIGTLATVKLNLLTEFSITQPDFLDVSSIQVKVDNVPAPFHYDPENHQIQLTSLYGTALSYVDIRYCDLPVNPHPLVSENCQADDFVPKPVLNLGVSMDPNILLSPEVTVLSSVMSNLSAMGISATAYTDAEVASGKLLQDGVNVLIISRKILSQSVSAGYIQGISEYIESGGSLIGEYDGAALLFDRFEGTHAAIPNFTPSFELFSGLIRGGGALLPLESSRTYVTDRFHPVMDGIPADFLLGARTAFALSEYDAEWLHPTASFISTGYLNLVPEGTYPAVLAGRCGKGRVSLYMMNYFQVLNQPLIQQMLRNTLDWSRGVTPGN